MTYFGNTPISGMTIEQQRACEQACNLAPQPYYHDGLMRDIAAALVGDPPWTDQEVQAAIVSTLQNNGISLPFFPA